MAWKWKVKCPYCGFENEVEHDVFYKKSHLVTCDSEEGGCDRNFVADVAVSVTTKARKIEGEEDAAAEG